MPKFFLELNAPSVIPTSSSCYWIYKFSNLRSCTYLSSRRLFHLGPQVQGPGTDSVPATKQRIILSLPLFSISIQLNTLFFLQHEFYPIGIFFYLLFYFSGTCNFRCEAWLSVLFSSKKLHSTHHIESLDTCIDH